MSGIFKIDPLLLFGYTYTDLHVCLAGLYWGVIHKLYPDDPSMCLVQFTDGDTEDLDADEVHYAIELYNKEFGEP